MLSTWGSACLWDPGPQDVAAESVLASHLWFLLQVALYPGSWLLEGGDLVTCLWLWYPLFGSLAWLQLGLLSD